MIALRDVLVVTDLDGTLLDHETYSWAAAAPALNVLRNARAGLVLASSKTAAEIAPIREDIRFAGWPAIVENGSGLLEPDARPAGDRATYDDLRKILKTLPRGFRGFGDMSTKEVSERTGLSIAAAERARQRDFSEPGIWDGGEETLMEFLSAAKASGLTAQRGGRFVTLSFGGTKADRVAEVIQRLTPAYTIILGDAPNDIEMLALADAGVIVANPASPDLPVLPGETRGRIRRTTRPGPEGWSEAVLGILEELETKKDARAHG